MPFGNLKAEDYRSLHHHFAFRFLSCQIQILQILEIQYHEICIYNIDKRDI